MARRTSKGLIRVGVVGIGRGYGFARAASERMGMKLVALCDVREEPLRAAGKDLGVATYTEYERFLEHDLDAVILANFFHEHAPLAVQALAAGKHVMSETAACFTMAQAAALVDAVEKSGKIYMFAENYPYMIFNQEMRRIYHTGAIGQFVYGEGEYVHPGPADFWNSISPGQAHWRNWLPATYYCTHALAPLMFVTDTMPAKVNACVMPYRDDDPVGARRAIRNDAASVITVRMDSGAVAKLVQFHMRGEGIWVRVHGSRGQMENLRQGDSNMVRLRREQYHEKITTPREQIYLPNWPAEHQAAAAAGHGGGDYFMNYHFSQAIRTGKQPYLDVYRGVAMSVVGIQAWRSALADSNTFEIPDFHDKAARKKYARDNWNPDPAQHTKDMPWPSILGNVKPSKAALVYAKKVWRRSGYAGE
jgi:predicted dehydrogenase